MGFINNFLSDMGLKAQPKRFISIDEHKLSSFVKLTVYVDSETGVNYAVVDNSTVNSGGITMTPLYNPDGTLIVTPLNKNNSHTVEV